MEKYVHVVLFIIMLYEVDLMFKSVDGIAVCLIRAKEQNFHIYSAVHCGSNYNRRKNFWHIELINPL